MRRRFERPGQVVTMAKSLPVVVACLVGPVGGCGGEADPFDRVPVEGTVSLDGAPLSRGTIRFIPEGSTVGPKVALPVADGSFRGDRTVGPVAGRHRVEVEPDESEEFPHDGEERLAQFADAAKSGKRRRRPATTSSRPSTTHTFVADETNQAHFDF